MALKPYPFCGSPGCHAMERSRKGIRLHGYLVICSDDENCPVVPMTRLCKSKEEAAELWNKRSVEEA